ncbi:MAG TPA: glucokinase [Chakrabartia sp.]|nr:glucokinase [Chakrabartia sp.]
MKLVTIDIGGTHARFALAEVAEGRVMHLGEAVTLKTADHASFLDAWAVFRMACPQPIPHAAALAVAATVKADPIRFTNNPWSLEPAQLAGQMGVDALTIVNDFEAVAHAVAQAGPDHFLHLTGPDQPLPATGTISVLGPGTGLGVAHLWRGPQGTHVQATEGGHLDFAPLDAFEDALLTRLRARHGRVSTERIVSGPGLIPVAETLAEMAGQSFTPTDDAALWQAGLSGSDALAVQAIDRFCLTLGSVAGDIALAQGGAGVVIAGGLGYRIRDVLVRSGFAERFRAKGRFAGLMAGLPVKLIIHPQPGLFGAAAAFSLEHP